MKNIIWITYFVFLLLSFIASLVIYSNKKAPFYLKLFAPFLFLTICVEGVGRIQDDKGMNNQFIYSCFLPILFSFHMYVAYNILKRKLLQKLIVIISSVYLAIVFFYLLTSINLGFPYYLFCAGSFIISVFYIIYILELRRLPISKTPKREPSFWISVGALFYYGGSLTIWIGNTVHPFTGHALDVLAYMATGLNYFQYSCIGMAFLCKKVFKKKNIPEIDWKEFTDYSSSSKKSYI